jgi:DNA-binding winged helix-turn-helix (wHTH) protein
VGERFRRKAESEQDRKVSVTTQLERIVLAQEAEFTLGRLRVCPSKREVIVATGCEHLQPRVMQVLVALARRRGEVVSRDELIAACWSGFAVSDDAIHRCIARIRRLAEAHGSFCLETVPRVGYQLKETNGALQTNDPRFPWMQRSIAVIVLFLACALLIAAGFISARLL